MLFLVKVRSVSSSHPAYWFRYNSLFGFPSLVSLGVQSSKQVVNLNVKFAIPKWWGHPWTTAHETMSMHVGTSSLVVHHIQN